MFIDTHAHINNDRLDSLAIIKNMEADELAVIINVSYNYKSIIDSLNLANTNEKIYAIIGVHPSETKDYNDETINLIKQFATNQKVLAIGEIGLDYHYEETDKTRQKEVLISQLKIADELKLPVVIHLRDAFLDFENLILENKKYLNNGMLLHCYSGSYEYASELMKNIDNVYFSFGGTLTFKNARNIAETFVKLPLERILSETDCPYLTPEPYRGQRVNEPALVKNVIEKMADLKGMSIESMSKIIFDNARKLFKKLI